MTWTALNIPIIVVVVALTQGNADIPDFELVTG
jgi:hypothetical protein